MLIHYGYCTIHYMTSGWKALGERMRARRTELGFPNRKAFQRDRKMTDTQYALIMALENNTRENFEQSTKDLVEWAYGWKAGGFDKILAGDEPESVFDYISNAGMTALGYTPPRALFEKMRQDADRDREATRPAQPEEGSIAEAALAMLAVRFARLSSDQITAVIRIVDAILDGPQEVMSEATDTTVSPLRTPRVEDPAPQKRAARPGRIHGIDDDETDTDDR